MNHKKLFVIALFIYILISQVAYAGNISGQWISFVANKTKNVIFIFSSDNFRGGAPSSTDGNWQVEDGKWEVINNELHVEMSDSRKKLLKIEFSNENRLVIKSDKEELIFHRAEEYMISNDCIDG